jgi:hypothetical protein
MKNSPIEKKDEITQSKMPLPTLVTLEKKVKTIIEELTGYHPFELHLLMNEVVLANSWEIGIDKFHINRYREVENAYVKANLTLQET